MAPRPMPSQAGRCGVNEPGEGSLSANHPLREVLRTLVEMGLNDSPLFARLEHVADELRTLHHGLTLIATRVNPDPASIAKFTLEQAAKDQGGAA